MNSNVKKIVPYLLGVVMLGFFIAPVGIVITTTSSDASGVRFSIEIPFASAQQIAARDEMELEAEAVAKAQKTQTGSGCESISGIGGAFCVGLNWVIAGIGKGLIYFFSLLQAVAGTLLNLAINWGVIQFGAKVGSLTVLNDAWATFRDLANLFFIFGLLLISIATMLQIEEYGYHKLLMRIIILALLVNFSLFITKAIIDVSNITATQFANAIQVCYGTNCSASNAQSATAVSGAIGGAVDLTSVVGFTSSDAGRAARTGPGNAFAQAMKLQQLNNALNESSKLDTLQVLFMILFGSLFILTSAVVFAAGAVILIIRVVVLMFLMVLSPLAFAAMAIPWTEALGRKWWSSLLSNAFYAPVFMLCLWFAAFLVNNPQFQKMFGVSGENQWGAIATASASAPDSMGIIFNFIFVIGALIASIWIAKHLSVTGTTLGMKLGALATFGVPAMLARGTAGWAGGALSRRSFVKNWAAGVDSKGREVGLLRKNIGKGLAVGSRAAARGTYDVRNISIPGFKEAGTLSGLAGAGGLDVGQGGGIGGYEAFVKRRAAQQKEFGTYLKPDEEERDKLRQEASKKYRFERESMEAPALAAAASVKSAEDLRTAVEQNVRRLESEIARLEAAGRTGDAEARKPDLADARTSLASSKKGVEDATSAMGKISQALNAIGEKEEKFVSDVGKTRQAGYAKRTKEEVGGITIPKRLRFILKQRGSVVGGIQLEEGMKKKSDTKMVDLLEEIAKGQAH